MFSLSDDKLHPITIVLSFLAAGNLSMLELSVVLDVVLVQTALQ